MKVNGAPWDDYHFKPAAASITYSMEYECEVARVWAGISISEWDMMPGTRMWLNNSGRSKSDIVLLHRMSNFIPNAAQDAQIREMDRKSKMKGGR